MRLRRVISFAAAAWFTVSCAAGRYASGPYGSEIKSIRSCDGTVEVVNYPSSEPALTEKRMVVYLPPDYYTDTLRNYPVLYLLHGARGNEVTWFERGDAFRKLDSLRRADQAEDFILVLPNTNNYYNDKDYMYGRPLPAMRAFWLVSGETERYFIHDVVDRVDSLYRTIDDRSARAIVGMSSGGLQALHLSANSGLFDYVGLFSSYAKPTFAALGHGDVYGPLWPKLEEQFADPPEKYSIYIGRNDFFLLHMKQFDRKLDRKGYEHDFTVSEGGHAWYNWSSYLTDFYKNVFK